MTIYYAITVNNGMITDRHESATPITSETFANSPVYAGHDVIEISEHGEYS